MELQPHLAARIRRRKSYLRGARSLLLAAVAGLCAAIVVLVIIPYAAGNTTFSPLVRQTGGAGSVPLLVFVALALDAALAALYIPAVMRDRRHYAKLTARAKEYDPYRLGLFMNALDGVSAKAGVKEPPIAVLDARAPNSLTFEGHGGSPVVGVTRGLLESEMEYGAAEAVMAHQLAGIAADDYLRKPGSFGFETAAYGMLALFSVLALASSPLVSAGRSTGVGVAFLAVAATLLLLGGLAVRKLRRPESHDYLLADSVAAGLTGKPGALADAITMLDELVNKKSKQPFPDSELGLKFLFVLPYRFSETAPQFFARRKRELDWETTAALTEKQVEGVQGVMDELSELGDALLAQRLENLQDA